MIYHEYFYHAYIGWEIYLMDDARTVLVETYYYVDYQHGWRMSSSKEVASLTAPIEKMPIFARQIVELLPGWRGRSWENDFWNNNIERICSVRKRVRERLAQ